MYMYVYLEAWKGQKINPFFCYSKREDRQASFGTLSLPVSYCGGLPELEHGNTLKSNASIAQVHIAPNQVNENSPAFSCLFTSCL